MLAAVVFLITVPQQRLAIGDRSCGNKSLPLRVVNRLTATRHATHEFPLHRCFPLIFIYFYEIHGVVVTGSIWGERSVAWPRPYRPPLQPNGCPGSSRYRFCRHGGWPSGPRARERRWSPDRRRGRQAPQGLARFQKGGGRENFREKPGRKRVVVDRHARRGQAPRCVERTDGMKKRRCG